ERVLAIEDPEVWEHTERLLYHNYSQYFDRVAPYLDRMRRSGFAPETYGRISMLSALAGHLDAEALLDDLAGLSDGMWKGVAQVLVANLASESSRVSCASLLSRLLSGTV